MSTTLPFPPLELANRVGALAEAEDPFALYDDLGRATKSSILSALPSEWSFDSKRVLDFGCGAGRTLRHFVPEARACKRFYACDIDGASVGWVQANLSPPFQAFLNGDEPPLELPSDSLDFVYAVSVFTHLTANWSHWLLELHRVLDTDGLLLATFIGPGASSWVTDEPWHEELVGMNVLRPGQSWELGGPMVLHSPWWIQEHWGRAFEILTLHTSGFGSEPHEGQGTVLMRKRSVAVTPKELERPEPGEPRELDALAHNVRQLAQEAAGLRAEYEHLAAAWRGEQARADRASRELAELRARLDSPSKFEAHDRLSGPGRALRRWLRLSSDEDT
jgi:SAM-dependent methyltransferase